MVFRLVLKVRCGRWSHKSQRVEAGIVLSWADVNPPSWDVLHSISQSQKSFQQHSKCHGQTFFFFFFMQRGEQTVHLTVHMKVQKQSAPQWQISNQTDSSSAFFFFILFFLFCISVQFSWSVLQKYFNNIFQSKHFSLPEIYFFWLKGSLTSRYF